VQETRHSLPKLLSGFSSCPHTKAHFQPAVDSIQNPTYNYSEQLYLFKNITDKLYSTKIESSTVAESSMGSIGANSSNSGKYSVIARTNSSASAESTFLSDIIP